jgi:hypothetical protein
MILVAIKLLIILFVHAISIIFVILLPESSDTEDSQEESSPPLLQSQCSVSPGDWHSVINALHSKLQAWTHHPQLLQLDVLLPHGMIEKVAKDITRMASSEVSGLNGMCIHVNLKRKLNKENVALGVI